jgi:hypothetical protein
MRLSIVKVFAFLILIFERAVHPNNLMLPYFFFSQGGRDSPKEKSLGGYSPYQATLEVVSLIQQVLWVHSIISLRNRSGARR